MGGSSDIKDCPIKVVSGKYAATTK